MNYGPDYGSENSGSSGGRDNGLDDWFVILLGPFPIILLNPVCWIAGFFIITWNPQLGIIGVIGVLYLLILLVGFIMSGALLSLFKR